MVLHSVKGEPIQGTWWIYSGLYLSDSRAFRCELQKQRKDVSSHQKRPFTLSQVNLSWWPLPDWQAAAAAAQRRNVVESSSQYQTGQCRGTAKSLESSSRLQFTCEGNKMASSQLTTVSGSCWLLSLWIMLTFEPNTDTLHPLSSMVVELSWIPYFAAESQTLLCFGVETPQKNNQNHKKSRKQRIKLKLKLFRSTKQSLKFCLALMNWSPNRCCQSNSKGLKVYQRFL